MPSPPADTDAHASDGSRSFSPGASWCLGSELPGAADPPPGQAGHEGNLGISHTPEHSGYKRDVRMRDIPGPAPSPLHFSGSPVLEAVALQRLPASCGKKFGLLSPNIPLLCFPIG